MRWSATLAKCFLCCVAATQWSLSMAIDETNQQQKGNPVETRARQLRGDLSRSSSEFSSSNRHNAGQITRSSDIGGTTNLASQLETESGNLNQLASSASVVEMMAPAPQEETITVCQPMTLDFAKASNGRGMYGGEFVRGEWFHGFGISIDAEGHDGKSNLHPMIFDSSDVESNGLGGLFGLGSPNFDCEGFGVGMGGKIGKAGENCKALGNILIPSRKKASTSSPNTSNHPPGGVLIFEFHKHTRVENIGFLNNGSSDQIMIIFNDGSLDRIDLHSVGQNGFQNIHLDMNRVKKMYVFLHSYGAVAGLDLCVAADH